MSKIDCKKVKYSVIADGIYRYSGADKEIAISIATAYIQRGGSVKILEHEKETHPQQDDDCLQDFYVIDMGDGEKDVTRSRLRVFRGSRMKGQPLKRRDIYRGRMEEAECEYANEFMCGGFPIGEDPQRPSRDEWLDEKPFSFEVDKFV